MRRAQAQVILGAEAADNLKAEALLLQASDEAVHVSGPYLVVRPAAVARRLLQQRNLAMELSARVDRLIAICETESNPIRRGDALLALALSVEHADRAHFRRPRPHARSRSSVRMGIAATTG